MSLDPKTGRWTAMDPIGFAAGDANWYRYVGNGPVNYNDPTGLDWSGMIGGGIAGGAFGAGFGSIAGVGLPGAVIGGSIGAIGGGIYGFFFTDNPVHGAIGGAVIGSVAGGLTAAWMAWGATAAAASAAQQASNAAMATEAAAAASAAAAYNAQYNNLLHTMQTSGNMAAYQQAMQALDFHRFIMQQTASEWARGQAIQSIQAIIAFLNENGFPRPM